MSSLLIYPSPYSILPSQASYPLQERTFPFFWFHQGLLSIAEVRRLFLPILQMLPVLAPLFLMVQEPSVGLLQPAVSGFRKADLKPQFFHHKPSSDMNHPFPYLPCKSFPLHLLLLPLSQPDRKSTP